MTNEVDTPCKLLGLGEKYVDIRLSDILPGVLTIMHLVYGWLIGSCIWADNNCRYFTMVEVYLFSLILSIITCVKCFPFVLRVEI